MVESAVIIKEDRRERILDAAEAHFARYGFDAVTLRAIARDAGVDVALANYHFGPKRDLFDAVLMRRARVLNTLRENALDAALARAAPYPASVEAIMRAYLEPLLTGPQASDPDWRNYYALVAYVNNNPEWGGRLMSQFFDPLIDRFLAALRLALPGAGEHALHWSYHCLSGALTLALAQTGRIDTLSRGLCRSDDLAGACETLIAFTTGGFERACCV